MEFLQSLTKTELLVILFLFLLLFITTIAQWGNKFSTFLRSKDLINFIPSWYFFAPHPVTYNIRLIYRDEFVGKQQGQWQQAEFATERKWYHFLWNPQKRYNKAFFDIYKGLLEDIEVLQEHHQIHLSVCYLLLLNFINTQKHSPLSIKTQFAILTDYVDGTPPEILFVSGWHQLASQTNTIPQRFILNT